MLRFSTWIAHWCYCKNILRTVYCNAVLKNFIFCNFHKWVPFISEVRFSANLIGTNSNWKRVLILVTDNFVQISYKCETSSQKQVADQCKWNKNLKCLLFTSMIIADLSRRMRNLREKMVIYKDYQLSSSVIELLIYVKELSWSAI